MFTQQSFCSIQPHRTAFSTAVNLTALKDNLRRCSEESFTGQLDLKIQDAQAKVWSLYFEQGNLVWGNGGMHPVRRWYRHALQHCPEDASNSIHETVNQVQSGSYESLIIWLSQKKVHLTDVNAILMGILSELLFDLYQEWSHRQDRAKIQIKFNYVLLDKLSSSLTLSIDEVWLQSLQDWQTWQTAGLESCCPNQAPVIRDIQALQQQVLPHTYQNLVKAINGNQTLRDLAAKSNRNLLDVTKSLLPYVQQGLMDLKEIEDLQPSKYELFDKEIRRTSQRLTPATKPQNRSFSPPKNEAPPLKLAHSTAPETQSLSPSNSVDSNFATPLIAYIDDYKVDGQTMNQILTEMGYRLIHIQDPMQALPLLLEHKPKLIFLDLVMPIINGYEACAQIRRISRFKDTPIIILTSNDGIIDRVRAKIVGSTDFLSKPIESKKIRMALQKYLLVN